MELFKTKPLELRKKDIDLWEKSGNICIAILENDKNTLQEIICEYFSELYKRFDNVFIVIWCISDIDSQSYYIEYFKSLSLIFKNDTCLIYSIKKGESELQKITKYWGEYDSLDIIFKKNEVGSDHFTIDFYEKYSQYNKDFINRITHSEAVISDSGDGEEAQIIMSDEVFKEIENTFL